MDDIDYERLRRAEAEVAALPAREPIEASPSSLEGTARGWLLAVAALLLCLVTAASETAWLSSDSPVVQMAAISIVFLLPGSVILAILAGSLVGRVGRVLGVIGGVAMLPPVSFLVAWPVATAFG